MAGSLFIETGWPARELSPNASHQRNIWKKKRAKDAAKNEGFIATCAALQPARTGPWGGGPPLGGGPLKVTIHAHPPTKRTRDDDNLTASCKSALDGIAKRLKIDNSQFQLPADPVARNSSARLHHFRDRGMKGAYIRSAIRAEVRRAIRDHRNINREQLKRETGLQDREGLRRFEVLVSEAYRDLGASPSVVSGEAGGAAGQERLGQTPRHPDPDAPPERKTRP